MTFGLLKKLTEGLLIGDNKLPKDDETIKALLSLAFNMTASKAESLHLLTLDQKDDILRTGTGDYLMRSPELPKDDMSELDIDDDLGYVAARYIASFISKEKSRVHELAAENLINNYNEKVDALMSRVSHNKEDGYHVQ